MPVVWILMAIVVGATFIVGVRVGIAIGYRAERRRRQLPAARKG